MPTLIQQMSGREGTAQIVELGAVIGEIQQWSLKRRPKNGVEGESDLWDLRATFTRVNAHLFDDPDYRVTVTVRFSRVKQYRLEQEKGHKVLLQGRSLLMEGVRPVAVG